MKRTAMIFFAATTTFLTSCDKLNKTEKNNTQQAQQERDTPMTHLRKKTDSGLEYEIIQEGAGESPAKGQHVTVHYTGWLDNNGQPGAKFDSSVDRGEPFTFIIGVGQVIQGWDEGVASMKVGEKRRLTIPSNLGYGARGAGRVIPPHATLIFDVELLKIS
ncbi:MAG: FKBP-type peptidyl-prolyl cis-trans isomerase [Candidatus Babeliaceae bacterium]|jgi:FKBP-type peptidyl-prolyl cis-trans isomerase